MCEYKIVIGNQLRSGRKQHSWL